MNFEIEYAFVIITLFCLIWAAYSDIRDRMVSDLIWATQFLATLPFLVIWFIDYATYFMRILAILNLIIAIIMAFGAYWLRVFYEGDRNAILAIGFSTPVFVGGLSLIDVPNSIFPAILAILTNYIIFMIIFGVSILIANLATKSRYGGFFGETSGSVLKKIAILLSGRRVPIDKIKELRYDDPAEEYDGETWKLSKALFIELEQDEDYEKIEKGHRETAHKNASDTARSFLWMRPQPPGMVFLFLAYFFWVLFGSPLYYYFT